MRTVALVSLVALLLPLPAPAAPAATGTVPASPGEAQLARDEKARTWFTDTVLLDQAGTERRLYTDVLAGKVVVVSFLYTRCEFACPLIAQKLTAVARGLGERYGRDVRFVTISVDPEHDGPVEMTRFLERHRAPQPGWLFLSGKSADVRGVLKRFGQLTRDPDDHYTGLVVGNVARGHWSRLRPDLSAAGVVEAVRALADEGPPGVAARLGGAP